jgi:hypothetical protein
VMSDLVACFDLGFVAVACRGSASTNKDIMVLSSRSSYARIEEWMRWCWRHSAWDA